MRAPFIVMAGLLAAAAVAPTAAEAQFPLDPRALIGRVTAPLRHMLPQPRARQRIIHRDSARHARDGKETRNLRRDGRDVGDNRDVRDVRDARSVNAQRAIAATALLGTVGPSVWPTAYQDVIGYTLWPDEYEAAYRRHGFGDIATTILTPAASPAPAPEARRRPAETTGSAGSDAASARPCDAEAVQTDWPKSQIEQTIQLNDAQRHAVDRLQATINGASKSIRAGVCRDTEFLTPNQRLGAMVQGLWAVQNAGVVIRGALKNFYDTLTDEQKAKFRVARQDMRQEARHDFQPAAQAASNPMGRQQACMQDAGDNRLIKQIQQTVRPEPQQQQSVETLAKTAGGMEQFLMASCAQPTPEDPLARLDAANARLTAINYAATSMEVALNQFQAALSDEQYKTFEAIGVR